MNKSLEIRFIGMYDELEEIRATFPQSRQCDIRPHFFRGKFTGKGQMSIWPCRSVIAIIKKIVKESEEVPF